MLYLWESQFSIVLNRKYKRHLPWHSYTFSLTHVTSQYTFAFCIAPFQAIYLFPLWYSICQLIGTSWHFSPTKRSSTCWLASACLVVGGSSLPPLPIGVFLGLSISFSGMSPMSTPLIIHSPIFCFKVYQRISEPYSDDLLILNSLLDFNTP